MIKLCLVDGLPGYYINGVVRCGKTGRKYDKARDTIIEDVIFNNKMSLYARTLDYLGKRFHKSVVWREKLLLKSLYGNYKGWCSAVDEMLYLNILSRDGTYLTLAERP